MESPRLIFAAITATSLAIMPLSLVGALSVEIRNEMHFSTSTLGQLVSMYFLALAVASVPAGHLVERLRPSRGLALGSIGSCTVLIGIALWARSWWQLLLLLILAGFSSAVVQPSANSTIARGASQARMGLVFGVKQSAVPLAGVIAGLMVPLVALTIGWRWAFALSSLGVVAVLSCSIGAPDARRTPRSAPKPDDDAPGHHLVMLAVAFAFGTAAAGSLSVFFVESAVASGMSLGSAGVLLSAASGAGVAARLIVGWLADTFVQSRLLMIAIMLGLGTVGFLSLGFGANRAVLVIGAFVSFGAGWGWPGLMNLSVVQMWSHRPAWSTGVAMTGMALGATVGPIVLGRVAHDLTFRPMWAVVAAASSVSALLVLRVRRDVRRAN